MDAVKCIETRRSIRTFKDKAVENCEIEKIVDTAKFAPSWKNTQTVRYIAIKDEKIKNELRDTCLMGFDHNAGIVDGAPVVMAVATVNERSGYERDGSFSTSKGTHWQSFDAGVASQTFCLTAHDMGLSTVIMGIFDAEKVHALLHLPETMSVSALIALGYGDESGREPVRKDTADILEIR